MAQQDHPPPHPRHDQHPDHDDNKDDNPTSGLKKKRIQQACRPCGIKRVKCDGSNPCITCIRSGEVCEYGQPKKRGPPKGSTRGGSKAAKRKAQVQLSAARKGAYEAAAAQPIQSTRDYAASTSADANTVPLSRPPPPPFPETDWSRTVAPGPVAIVGALPSSSRYPAHNAIHPLPHPSIPSHHTAPVGALASNGPFPPDAHVEPHSAHASPEGSYRTESHRTGGSVHDGSVGSPNYAAANSSSPNYYPPHSYSSRYDAQAPKQRTETFYRGSSSGLGFIRPPPASADRRLPPLDFFGTRSSNRSSSSPSNFGGRLSVGSDTFESALSGRSGANRSLGKTTGSHARPSPTASTSAQSASAANPLTGPSVTSAPYDATSTHSDASRFDNRSMQSNPAATAQASNGGHWPSAQNSLPSQAHPASDVADSDTKPAIGRPAGIRQNTGDNNRLLVEGTLLQLQRDRDRDRARTDPSGTGTSAARPHDVPEDVNLEPLLWVEPGDESRSGVNRSGVSLTKPEIPPLIQERLFTIFWGIVQTIWPALYKPALCLTGFNVIDPEKHPMLHNAACALAAVAWDSGEFGVSEEDTEATQSDWVERTASDLSFSQGAGQLGDGTSLRRLSAADLGDIFLARAKYYLVKTNNEPSLETIQSLLFMALREGGNGRASQASAYLSTACRMCIDLGLHRQRDFSSVLGLHFSHAEEQARRRIFWCLYLLDKTSSASLGRPVTLRYVEIDCPLPNIDEVDEHETWAETTNNSSLIKDRARSILLKTPVAAMTHLRFGVRLGHICEEVIAMYTRVKRPTEEEEAGDRANQGAEGDEGAVPEWETRLIRLHRMVDSWERDLPYRLRFENPAHRLPNTLSQHLWFQACKVMLHRPYILKQSSRPDLPPSHRICTDAVGRICDILTAYDNNFGMRKLSSTFTYCIFTASTIEIANTTSTDAVIAIEAKRRLRKFMTWLSRMSGTWQSASHHLKILEQLGHGIDADLDGTGLPSHREPSAPGSLTASRADSPSAAAITAATSAIAKSAGGDVGPSPLSLPREAQSLIVDEALQSVSNEQQQPPRNQGGEDLNSAAAPGGLTLQQPGIAPDDMMGLSVPGPIGAPMYLTRSRTSYQIPPAIQDDLHAQFQAQGQNPGLLYGWPATSRVPTPNPNTNAAVFDANAPAPTVTDRVASPAAIGASSAATPSGGQVNPTAYLKLHDTSYWGAMPLASEDALSWANFTSSYIEALNGMTHPISTTTATSAAAPYTGAAQTSTAVATTATTQ
ncbi:related to nitrogen assimilation transcription factor [Ustilago trichophora]|uniref:Related to nitrogen assimilation transcription factor n=1 Tax=Ustilago trichophora TaxID=86804 RepID=A0A5C3ET66_9BASI|nr:related to nitrogen assimilation transcription factor [Ustilago trichophora]